MLDKKSYLFVSLVLLIMPLCITIYKYTINQVSINDIIPREVYEVKLELDMAEIPSNSYIKTFLPQSNYRQVISHSKSSGDSLSMEKYWDDLNLGVRWEFDTLQNALFNYTFQVEGKHVKYDIPKQSPFESIFDQSIDTYLKSEKFIQSTHPKVVSLSNELKKSTVLETLKSNFGYVNAIKESNTRILTDALSALKLNRASCNGKSRLFTAICRAQGIPARVVGGTILENIRKRTSHLWAEVYYGGNWIPFDIFNNHFASLPAHYLELYKGDQYLFRHNKSLNFDYQFIISKKYQTLDEAKVRGPHLWLLLRDFHISMNLLRTLLLLPLAALLITIFRNVIGVKTFGILLPALIGLALVNINLITGLLAFAVVISLVTLLHMYLEKWSLLHIPKVAIILTCVIILLICLSCLGSVLDWVVAQMMIFLPIVIVSITAERFAKILIDENLNDALKMLFNTLGIALVTCLIFKSKVLLGIFLTYPELYLSILLVKLLLGRWIGMRVLEYNRFAPSLN